MSDSGVRIPVNGTCAVHGCMKITEDGVPVCLTCRNIEVREKATPAGIVTIEDPGTNWKEKADAGRPVAAETQKAQTAGLPTLPARSETFEQHITTCIEFLRGAPMPKDLKHFKAVQKAIQALEKTQEKLNVN